MESYRGILYDLVKGAVPGMKDPTISEVMSKKLTLARDILTLIKKFEEETDLRVDNIQTRGDLERTEEIEVIVLL